MGQTADTVKDAATWRRGERDKLIRLVRRLGRPYHLSHNNETNWSVFVVRGGTSTHITFKESGHTYVTRIYNDGRGNQETEVVWLPGGLYAWIGELQITDSEMAEAFLDDL
jgi:hypothetical protein